MPSKTKGFASLSPEERRAISSKAGKRAHELGKAHQWTPETAAKAGKIGGSLSRRGPTKKPLSN